MLTEKAKCNNGTQRNQNSERSEIIVHSSIKKRIEAGRRKKTRQIQARKKRKEKGEVGGP